MKNPIALLMIFALMLAGCAGGAVTRHKVSSPASVTGTFTLMVLIEGHAVDGLFGAVLDDPADNVKISKSSAGTLYKTYKGVTIRQALDHALPLMKKHCAYSGYRVNRLMHGRDNAGYEITPIHSDFLCSPAPHVSVRYTDAGHKHIKTSLSVIQYRGAPQKD